MRPITRLYPLLISLFAACITNVRGEEITTAEYLVSTDVDTNINTLWYTSITTLFDASGIPTTILTSLVGSSSATIVPTPDISVSSLPPTESVVLTTTTTTTTPGATISEPVKTNPVTGSTTIKLSGLPISATTPTPTSISQPTTSTLQSTSSLDSVSSSFSDGPGATISEPIKTNPVTGLTSIKLSGLPTPTTRSTLVTTQSTSSGLVGSASLDTISSSDVVTTTLESASISSLVLSTSESLTTTSVDTGSSSGTFRIGEPYRTPSNAIIPLSLPPQLKTTATTLLTSSPLAPLESTFPSASLGSSSATTTPPILVAKAKVAPSITEICATSYTYIVIQPTTIAIPATEGWEFTLDGTIWTVPTGAAWKIVFSGEVPSATPMVAKPKGRFMKRN